jgi:rhamnosyltransferase
VVVDSGSSDGSPEAAAEAGAYVFKIDQAEFNHGRTRNLAIARARGELIALLTQDARPLGPSYLQNLVRPFDDPAIDGVYARQFPLPDCDPLLAERLRQWSAARTEPERRALALGDPAAARARFDALAPFERYLTCAFDDVASALRRSTWERIPLPERAFGEDVAWARAVLLSGGQIAFEPSAEVEHSHRVDLRREFRRLYCDHRNLYELFGLRNVTCWSGVWKGWAWQRSFYARLLAGQALSRAQRLYWRAYSIPYALAETSAQFLGARSPWKTRESRFWAWVDRRLRSGV